VTEAEPMQRATLAALERVLGADHPATLAAAETLASIVARLQGEAEAGALLRRVVEGRRRLLGPDHRDTVRAERQLAELQATAGGVAVAPHPGPTTPPEAPDRSVPGGPPS
jgi:hypothetical protein